MIKSLLIASLLLRFSTQQCGFGCLVCNTSNKCLACDTSSNFFLSGSACVYYKFDDCQMITNSGNCLVCAQGHYFNPQTQLCLKVSLNLVVPNCVQYDMNKVCVLCDKGFYPYYGKCLPVSIAVANCLVYADNGVCRQCQPGFIFSQD